jgi:hypothetical protein
LKKNEEEARKRGKILILILDQLMRPGGGDRLVKVFEWRSSLRSGVVLGIIFIQKDPRIIVFNKFYNFFFFSLCKFFSGKDTHSKDESFSLLR